MKRGKPRQCAYCGTRMKYGPQHQGDPRQATKDHIIAKCVGGDQTVRCCAGCNADKQHLTLNEWRGALSIRHGRPHIFYFERFIPRMMIQVFIWRAAYALCSACF